TQFDLRLHMESPDWTEINAGIQQHLQKVYNTNKAAFKAQHWVIYPTTGTYNVEKIRRGRPQPLRSTRRSLTPSSWHTLLMENSFGMRTDGEMRRLEATGSYTDDEINRLARGGKQRGHIVGVSRVLPARATASPCTPVHESTLNSLHKKVNFMMSLFKSDSKYSYMFSQFESGGASGSVGCGEEEEGADHQDDEDDDGDT
nr:F-box domain, leucine-rich repeat domain, L domain-like protein [Tanacetum cinerariifolium]